jgi:hypothetical protein
LTPGGGTTVLPPPELFSPEAGRSATSAWGGLYLFSIAAP